jgi:hypothetical protein
MSDLNEMVNEWRANFGELSADQIDELEDHLRTEIQALARQGLSEREAFVVAAMRCGKPSTLEYEISRGDPAAAWSRRLRWMVVGVIVSSILNLLIGGLSGATGAALIVDGVGLPQVIALRFASISAIIFAVMLAFHLWLRARPHTLSGDPPRWLTTGWALMLMLIVMPWVLASASVIRSLTLARWLTVTQYGQLAISESIVQFVIPFISPIILFMFAVALSKRRALSA